MGNFQISFMKKSDIQESSKVLSIAMLNTQLHIAVLQGNSENDIDWRKSVWHTEWARHKHKNKRMG